MEKISNLFFELSHEDRLRIFYMIQRSPAKLTHLSEKLNLQVQETSRHLSRMSDAKLILKDVEGFYHLTPYGDHIMKLLPGFEFLSKHRNHFLAHKSSYLPEEFVSRIGELNKCKLIDDLMGMLQEAKTGFEEAKEQIWILSDHLLITTPPALESVMRRGVKVKLLLLDSIVFPPGFQPIPFIPNRIETKILERVDIEIGLNEKRALITFKNADDKIDHSGFETTDEISHKWCKDLFEYYWARAKIGTPSRTTLQFDLEKREEVTRGTDS